MADAKAHWEAIYREKAEDEVSWYQPQATVSLRLIAQVGLAPEAPILDAGGGASRLVDGLLARGFSAITVLDLAGDALARARARLGAAAERVRWLEADLLDAALPAARFALWHDRAVFHFLTTQAERSRYRAQLLHALAPEGWLVLGTFAEDGPERCSGLPVARWSSEALAAEFAPQFRLVHAERQCHRTPRGAEQRFSWCLLRRAAA